MLSLYDFYMIEIQSQFPATQWMIEGGLHIDTVALTETRKRLRNEVASLESELAKQLKWIPNTKSSIDMGKLLAQFNVTVSRTKTGKPKIGKEDLLGYSHKFPNVRPILDVCLEITKRRTIQSNFLDMALDKRDYYHPTYRLNGTKSGRFASEGADEGGPQGQNWPHSLLNLVIPDNPLTDELTEADLSQAEDMIIAWDAEDMVMIDAFQKHVDSHLLKACWAFRNWDYQLGLPLPSLLSSITIACNKCRREGQSKCNHSERFIAKQSGYAFKYKMGVRKFVTKILPPAGVYITEKEGLRIRERVVTPPTIKWQNETDRELRRSRWLTNLLGRKREFYGLHDPNGELLREALSWKAQSVVGVIAGRAVARLETSLRRIGPTCRLCTQRHDSVLVSHKRTERAMVREAISEAFYSPINAHGRTLNIPLEFKSGPNWRDLH